MTVETVDDLLKGIITSLDSTIASVKQTKEESMEEAFPQMVNDLIKKLQVDKLEGVSLLSLKNHSLLSYLNNLVLVILSHLQRLDEEEDIDSIENLKSKAVENTIVQRVSLEKGIKPLEKKLGYQLDKMIRSYNRMVADDEKIESKVEKEQEEQSSGDESSNDEEDEIDELSYKPDVSALANLSKTKGKAEKGSREDSKEKYKPPKISAMAPPSKAIQESEKIQSDGRKLQSMEEYLRENSDLPQSETSIGASIVNNGRGGVKTAHERQKEKEIQEYEENNFTRLPNTKTKKSFKEKQKEMVNTFGGEDWSMFNNNRNINEGTSRKRKPASAWDRVKKRRS